MSQFQLLTASNPKIAKGTARGYLTFALHLAPARLSGFQVCPMATEGCRAACLNTAGHGGLMGGSSRLTEGDIASGKVNAIQAVRIRRTRAFFADRVAFMGMLVAEIERALVVARKAGLKPAFRLNATSDIRWEAVPAVRSGVAYRNVMEAFPDVQFYDYTKIANRRGLPSNYRLTFSLADGNDKLARLAAEAGMNVAAVFRDKATVRGRIMTGFAVDGLALPVVDGDETDLRFLDPPNVVVALYAKGHASKDRTGFVRD